DYVNAGQRSMISRVIDAVMNRLNNKLDFAWQYKEYLYKGEIGRFKDILKENKLDERVSVDILRNYGEFKKHVLLRLHPDKGGRGEDFIFARELQQKMSSDIDIKGMIGEKAAEVEVVIYKAALSIKIADTVVDVLRVVNRPTVENVKQVVLGTVHVYGMYKGLSVYGLALVGLEATYQVYQGEYAEALKQVLITTVYMALPIVMGAGGLPHAGLIFTSGMTVYSLYHLMSNVHSLYIEYTSDENGVRSASGYGEVYSLLARTPLQYVYEFDSSRGEYNELMQEQEQPKGFEEVLNEP
ncbi:hypothetical protein, partial [Rickettsiales endosymbiont of Peranema trichophorum]|uniref:hypothetical protein n=1 Tax=Rickettsiales endosymbiont of Peranema trichophorum TaxID=2486577 RepID=UPI001A917FED